MGRAQLEGHPPEACQLSRRPRAEGDLAARGGRRARIGLGRALAAGVARDSGACLQMHLQAHAGPSWISVCWVLEAVELASTARGAANRRAAEILELA